MQWDLDKIRPLCPQICEQLCVGIATGELQPGARLLSVREIAVLTGVNPNTVQKSFERLADAGIVFAVRGSGWFVSEDISAAQETVRQLREEKTAAYFAAMAQIGMTEQEIKTYIKEWVQHE